MSEKVCVVGLRGFPNVMGGIETHCEYLYRSLSTLDPSFDIFVLARRPYVGRLAYSVNQCNVVPIWTVKHPKFETALHTFFSIIYARFFIKARLLHLHAIGSALFLPLAKIFGMRVIATHHGADYERQKWDSVAKFFLRLGERLMVYGADRIICVSASSAATLQRRYPSASQRILHIPNGVPQPAPNLEDTGILEQLKLAPNGYILSVGRLVPEKGFPYLIKAFRAARLARPLVIVGSSDHDTAFAERLRQEASDDVVFAGQLSHNALTPLYRHAALFILPSFHEGLPIAALEAIGSGCPILLSDIPANREIGLPPHHYFAVGDVPALTAVLQRGDFARLRVRDDGVLKRFDWEEIARQTAKCFDAVAAA